MKRVGLIIAASLLLASCGKPSGEKASADQCASAKGAPGIESDEQAQQACRDNKKFLGPDAKRSNIQIENH